MNPLPTRGPLRHIILAATGQDIRACAHCGACDQQLTPEMDLTLGELFQAAAQNDPIALKSRTLWACDPVALQRHRCQGKIDLPAVIMAMRQEANLRGLPIRVDPQDEGAEP